VSVAVVGAAYEGKLRGGNEKRFKRQDEFAIYLCR
jgi:hypothetical protein